MQHRQSTASKPVFSSSNLVAALAQALSDIKREDGLTYNDLGAVLGKSAETAAKYCDGQATMDAVCLARGRREWGSRFTGPFERISAPIDNDGLADLASMSRVSRVLHVIAGALEANGTISAEFIALNRSAFEDARDAIDAHLRKTGPKVVA